MSQYFFRETKLNKICGTKKYWRLNLTDSAIITFAPHCAKPMLYAVLFIRCVWKYAGEVRKIYSFFSVGKKREGKSSFCIFFGKRVG